MKKYTRIFVVLVALTAMIGTTIVGQVQGQSNALTITPRKDYSLQPGKSVDDTFTVENRNTSDTLNLSLSVVDFEAQDESGVPKLMRDSTDRTAWSLKNYIEVPQQVTIAPGETARIPITITMPNDIGAGSYYSAIEYSARGQRAEEQVNISASSVSLIFVTVPGQTKSQLSLAQFGAFVPSNSSSGGSFKGLYFGDRPKVLAYRLKNDGNIAEQPRGSLVVKNFSGKEVYTVKDANQKKQLALRGQTRRFEVCINPENSTEATPSGTDVTAIICGDTKLSPGRYTAELSLIYGSNGNETREITSKATFWYLPWWFIGVVVVTLALIMGAIYYVWRRIEAYRGRKTRRR